MPALDYSYVGVGKVYLREIGAALGLIEVGNCSALSFGVTEEEKKLRDFTGPGGGTRNQIKRIDSVEAQLTIHDLNANNLARALYGTVSAVASGVVSAEVTTAYNDALISLANIAAVAPVPTVAAGIGAVARVNTTVVALNARLIPAAPNGFYYLVTVAGTTAAAPPVFPTIVGDTIADGTATIRCAGKTAPVAGTDFTVSGAGLYTGLNVTLPGEQWNVTYTRAPTDVVNALTSSGKEYEMVFEGLNEARSGKRTKVTAYRVKPGALQALGLISDDYAAIEVSGEVLSDPTKVGAGISKYFRVEFEV